MELLQTKERFIELRAKGWSFDKIAKEIGKAKQTLIDWSKELQDEIANKERLDFINEIIEEYQQEGYVLTLRQLYYQLVSRDIIPNKQNEYSKLSTLLKEGRMAAIS